MLKVFVLMIWGVWDRDSHVQCCFTGAASAWLRILRFKNWVAVKELKLSYYIGETLSLTIYTHYGYFFKFLNSNPEKRRGKTSRFPPGIPPESLKPAFLNQMPVPPTCQAV